MREKHIKPLQNAKESFEAQNHGKIREKQQQKWKDREKLPLEVMSGAFSHACITCITNENHRKKVENA